MKKILALIMAFAMAMSMVACSSAPASSESTEESTETTVEVTSINDLYMYVDGADVTDGNTAYDTIKDKFAATEVDGNAYTGVTITDLCPYDISTVVGVFAEAADGFVRYYTTKDVTVVLDVAEDGTAQYGTVVAGQDPIYGITNIYMVTTAAEFSVPVKVNGEEIGVITMSDFMKKTPVGDKKVTTAMFDGSFKYKGGEATYTGRFLGINYETMVAKLAALGMTIEGTVVECEIYGTPGMGAEGKNAEYSKYPDEKAFYENLEFFVMYDGMTNNKSIKDVPMGLAAFINHTGQKWVTYSVTEINFITE